MRQRYEVQVDGSVSPDVLMDCEAEMRLRTVTVISGEIRDQSELHGILRRLHGLGIDVVALRTGEAPPDES